MEQGLGKYCDPDFVRYTSREMQEALDLTTEEMDVAAHQLLLQQQLHEHATVATANNYASNKKQNTPLKSSARL